MLSLSIAISILVKFCLFDLVGFFQVNSSGSGLGLGLGLGQGLGLT